MVITHEKLNVVYTQMTLQHYTWILRSPDSSYPCDIDAVYHLNCHFYSLYCTQDMPVNFAHAHTLCIHIIFISSLNIVVLYEWMVSSALELNSAIISCTLTSNSELNNFLAHWLPTQSKFFVVSAWLKLWLPSLHPRRLVKPIWNLYLSQFRYTWSSKLCFYTRNGHY